MVVQGAWADSSFGGGDGSAKNPYIINTTAHWDQLATDVNAGTNYKGTYFQLTDNISVTSMVGQGTNRFQGRFDGNGKTITFNVTATEDYCAPFCRISGATIKNLHTAGTITTDYRYAAGIVAYTRYTSKIQNCHSSVVIRSSHAGFSGHGGILALKAEVSSSTPTIEGCLFDGKILSTQTGDNASTWCGGIVGYTNGQTLTIKNCLYKPAALADGEAYAGGSTIYNNSTNSQPKTTVTCENCYYFDTLGDAQGKHARSIGFKDGIDINVVPKGTATEYSVSGITGYGGNQCVKYNDVVYAGSEDVVELTFSHNYAGVTVTDYEVEEGGATLEGNDTDGYTLTMADANVIFKFTMTGSDIPTIGGNGTYSSPFLITSSSDWDYIVSVVDNGKEYISGQDADHNPVYSEYATAYYKLTADITVTTMMGFDSYRFKGHFDGDSHTLTVDYGGSEQYAAPFRYVDGAEISNLVVAGTIMTPKKYSGSLIGNSKGATTLTNCRSNVAIYNYVNGQASHGGFVGYNTGGALTITGCVFNGYMKGSGARGCAGFVGWNEANDGANGTVSITNSLFAPEGTQQVIEKTFVCSSSYDTGVITITNSHCTADYDNDQQSRVYSISGSDGVTITYDVAGEANYSVSGLTTYNVGLKFDGVLYAKKDDQLAITLSGTPPEGSHVSGFATTAGTLSGTSNPYTLTMTNANATIYATYSIDVKPWTGNGDGSEQQPYIISSSTLWDEFVSKVNSGMEGFATAYYKLADDITGITVTTMVGTEGYKFKGHFDGNGKTLTLSYGAADAPFDEDYCAPFRHIEGAYIHNLIVEGTIYTGKQFAAGIAGCTHSANTITDCRSSVVINSSVSGDGSHGGFVAYNPSGALTITGCAFNGKLLGSSTNNCGGFVGWTECYNGARVIFSNCIFAPSEVSVSTDGSATFSRGRYGNSTGITVENSYYIQNLGTEQGEMAYTQKPDNMTTKAVTIAGVTVYVKTIPVTNVAATSITPTTATISWTGIDGCSNYQVRYRAKSDTYTYYTSFEDGIPVGWTMFDIDDKADNWTYYDTSEDDEDDITPHSGNGCMYSASYTDDGAVQPDNWLVSKQLDLGGTMRVWLKGENSNYYKEHFAIYLSTAGNTKADFVDADGKLLSTVVTLVPETETTSEYQQYTADLSAYSGKGYIAIRHFNCYDEYFLVLDDFGIYNVNEWNSEDDASPGGTELSKLTPNTEYEYQVGYRYDGNTYYTSTATLTTLAEDVAPTDLSATAITSNTATVSWTGYGDSYNLRYGQGGTAKVTLSVPEGVWSDGSGYQMLLDDDHNTYGRVIPESGGLTLDGDASAETYAEFEYKIPENADGKLDTKNVVDGTNTTELTITIPAGVYDWCITNPSPGDRVWIASKNGNIGGRQDDFTFEAGKHYTFTVTYDDDEEVDCVDMTVTDDPTLITGDVTEVTGINKTSYTLSGLTAQTVYTVYVQSVKGDKTSEWSGTFFTTADVTSIGLVDDRDNTAVITANNEQQRNVTLVDRTLYKDGDWNTLCLPFDVTIAGSPLDGAEVMELDVENKWKMDNGQWMIDNVNGTNQTGLDSEGTLYLYFKDADEIEAGKPYLIKWTNDVTNIVSPIKFSNVEIKGASPEIIESADGKVSIIGNYDPVTLTGGDASNLYLGADNKLYYPAEGKDRIINAFRGYFHVDLTGSVNAVRAFVLNFGDEDFATGIISTTNLTNYTNSAGAGWFDLQGCKLSGKPTKKGVYINNGKKVVIK